MGSGVFSTHPLRDFARFLPPFVASGPINGLENGLQARIHRLSPPSVLLMSICEHRHDVQNRPHARIGRISAPYMWGFLPIKPPHLAIICRRFASIAGSGPTPPHARNTEADEPVRQEW